MTTGDFNNDSVLDFALGGMSYVHIYAGQDSDYPSAAPVNLETLGAAMEFVASGDVNGDGIDDLLAVSKFGTDTLYLWLGKNGSMPDNSGMLEFGTAPNNFPMLPVLDDLNGDGIDDMLVRHLSDDVFSYWLGSYPDGPDNESRMTVDVLRVPQVLAIIDMNLDNINDVVASVTSGGPFPTDILAIFPGTIAGPDEGAVFYYETDYYAEQFRIADLLDTGIPQLIFGQDFREAHVIHPVNGALKQLKTDFTITGYYNNFYHHHLALGNLTGTGVPGLVLKPDVNQAGFAFLKDTCGYSRGSGEDRYTFEQAFSTVIADFDGDGVDDLVCAVTVADELHYFRGMAGSAPEMTPTKILPVVAAPKAPCAGDVNGDGISDLITNNYNTTTGVTVFLCAPGVGPTNSARVDLVLPGHICDDVAIGDFDNDGFNDIVASESSTDIIRWFPGPIDVGYDPAGARDIYGKNMITDFRIGDFNGDGVDDIAYTDLHNTAFVCPGIDGAGLDNAFVKELPLYSYPHDIYVSDFNLDGLDDLVIGISDNAAIFVFFGTPGIGSGGGIGSTPDVELNAPTSAGDIEAADMNSDGYLDLILAGGSNRAYIHFWKPGIGFVNGSHVEYPYEGVSTFMATADVNCDGISDAVLCSLMGPEITYLPGMAGAGPRPRANGMLSGSGENRHINIGDFNADCLADMVVSDNRDNVRLFLSHAGRQTFAFTLGNSGGVFTPLRSESMFCGGVILDVPAGAVTNKHDIVMLHPMFRRLPKITGGALRPISKPVLLMRETLALSDNATLTIPISAGVDDADWAGAEHDKVAAMRHERETDTWTPIGPLTINDPARTVSFSIERFGYYILVLKP
jgi:hypothetical protein